MIDTPGQVEAMRLTYEDRIKALEWDVTVLTAADEVNGELIDKLRAQLGEAERERDDARSALRDAGRVFVHLADVFAGRCVFDAEMVEAVIARREGDEG